MLMWCAIVVVIGCASDDKGGDETGDWEPFDGSDGGGSGGGAGGGGGSGGDDGGGTGGGTGDCDSLEPKVCMETSRCATIDGRPMDIDEAGIPCVDWATEAVPLGCMDAKEGCGDAETLATPIEGPTECWWFPSTCIPAGWTYCKYGSYGEC